MSCRRATDEPTGSAIEILAGIVAEIVTEILAGIATRIVTGIVTGSEKDHVAESEQ